MFSGRISDIWSAPTSSNTVFRVNLFILYLCHMTCRTTTNSLRELLYALSYDNLVRLNSAARCLCWSSGNQALPIHCACSETSFSRSKAKLDTICIQTFNGDRATMADSRAPETSTPQPLQGTTKEPAKLEHNVPFPQNIEKSKLDWLLQINEQFFGAELRTVVSNFQILPKFYLAPFYFPVVFKTFSNSLQFHCSSYFRASASRT